MSRGELFYGRLLPIQVVFEAPLTAVFDSDGLPEVDLLKSASADDASSLPAVYEVISWFWFSIQPSNHGVYDGPRIVLPFLTLHVCDPWVPHAAWPA